MSSNQAQLRNPHTIKIYIVHYNACGLRPRSVCLNPYPVKYQSCNPRTTIAQKPFITEQKEFYYLILFNYSKFEYLKYLKRAAEFNF